MSFINLRLLLEDGVKQQALKPDEKMCPIMSAVNIVQGPMQSEPSLEVKTIICVKELCAMYPRCSNTPA